MPPKTPIKTAKKTDKLETQSNLKEQTQEERVSKLSGKYPSMIGAKRFAKVWPDDLRN